MYKNDYAVITGSMVLDANTQENAVNGKTTKTATAIDFPSGFNADNCVIVSAGRYGTAQGMITYGWSDYLSSMDLFFGNVPFSISLNKTNTTAFSEKIRIEAGNLTTSQQTMYFKIVLMKI